MATSDKIGVCSWKLRQKMRQRYADAITEEVLNGDYQVLSFTRNSRKHQMIAMARLWHPAFIEALDMLWDRLGFKRPGEVKQPIYQNAYMATREIYQDYVNSFLKPSMELIEQDAQLKEIMLRPSGYAKLNRKHCDPKSVREKLGMSDYPLAPFVLERCPSLWYQMRNVNVTYL